MPAISKTPLQYPSSSTNQVQTNFDFVHFIPYIWNTGDQFGGAVQKLGNITSLAGAKEVIVEAVQGAVKAAGDIKNSKEDFIKSLKHIKVGNEALAIILPFNAAQTSAINHSLSWNAENAANAAFIQHLGGAVQDVIQGKVMDAAKDAAQAAMAKTREFAINALEQGGVKLGNFGLAVYQPKRQMFGGVESLAFGFEWDLVPRNPEEAKTIIDIIDSFRFLAYPARLGAAEIAKSAIRQPALWKVKFPSGDSTNSLFANLLAAKNEFLCVIDKVDFAIGATSDASKMFFRFEDDMPNMIKMSVGFKEYFNPLDGLDRFGETVANKFMTGGKFNLLDQLPEEKAK